MTLKELRESQGYGQIDVAAFCGVAIPTVSTWENGKASPRPIHVRRLAEFFKKSVPEIRDAIRNSGGTADDD